MLVSSCFTSKDIKEVWLTCTNSVMENKNKKEEGKNETSCRN